MTQTNENVQPAKKPMNVKKIAIIAGVTVLVILAAILVDSAIRNPRCRDETDALNVLIQKVLPGLDELADNEGFALDVQEIEKIGTTEYYPVFITRYPRCDDGATARRVVEERVLPDMNLSSADVQLDVMRTEAIGSDRYYVVDVSRITGGKKEILATIYVQEQNAQPFTKDENGELVEAAEEVGVPLRTAYVRLRDSKPFYKDDTTGRLIPYDE